MGKYTVYGSKEEDGYPLTVSGFHQQVSLDQIPKLIVKGKSIEEIKVTTQGICVTFSAHLVFRVEGAEIVFGADDKG
jgi:hypothetical protein